MSISRWASAAIVLSTTKSPIAADADDTVFRCMSHERILNSPFLRLIAVLGLVWWLQYTLRETLPFWLLCSFNVAHFAIGVARLLIMFNAMITRIASELLRQFDTLWLFGNLTVYFISSTASSLSDGDRAYWRDRGWPVDSYFIAYAAYQVSLFGWIAMAFFAFIRVDALPGVSQSQRFAFASVGVMFFIEVFVDNCLGRADIQTPIRVPFLFETDTIQLRNTSLINLAILVAKMCVKMIARAGETVSLCTTLQIEVLHEHSLQTAHRTALVQ
jgi:hypothetical protein